MVGNANSGNGGNPNIANERKTGPITDDGKFRGRVLAQAYGEGTHTKLLNKMMRCDRCPMRAKERMVKTKNGLVNMVTPAVCSYYKAGSRKCTLDVQNFLHRSRVYYIAEKEGFNELEFAKAHALDIAADVALSREMEIISKGHPAGYTDMFSDNLTSQLSEINKMKHGIINKNLNLNIDASTAIVNAWKEVKKENDSREDKTDKSREDCES